MKYANKNERWEDLLIELIAYLEFDLDYDEHKELFDRFLSVRGMSKETLETLIRKDAMQFALSKRNIANHLSWIKRARHDKAIMNKTVAVEWIYQLCHDGNVGIYEFRDAVSHYRLVITANIMRLENTTKGIRYRIF